MVSILIFILKLVFYIIRIILYVPFKYLEVFMWVFASAFAFAYAYFFHRDNPIIALLFFLMHMCINGLIIIYGRNNFKKNKNGLISLPKSYDTMTFKME